MELDSLIMGRNELAKWNKLNSKRHDIHIPNKEKNAIPVDEPLYKYNEKNINSEDDDTKMNKVEIHQNQQQQIWRDYENIRVIHLPPMINRVNECKMCFSKEVCALASISLERDL